MDLPPWDAYLTERDRAVFKAAGYGEHGGMGRRPALLVIDVNYDFVGEASLPILESIKVWRNSSGEEGWEAVARISALLEAARAKALPIFHANILRRPDKWDSGGWKWKNTRNQEHNSLLETGKPGVSFVEETAPRPHEFVVWKQRPSAFFGTTLITHLIELGVDTVIVCGGTTSGCVRATVVDAFSYNLRSIVVADACFDRSQASHAINLCDMHAKYADVISAADAIEAISGVQEDLYPSLPKAPADEQSSHADR